MHRVRKACVGSAIGKTSATGRHGCEDTRIAAEQALESTRIAAQQVTEEVKVAEAPRRYTKLDRWQ